MENKEDEFFFSLVFFSKTITLDIESVEEEGTRKDRMEETPCSSNSKLEKCMETLEKLFASFKEDAPNRDQAFS